MADEIRDESAGDETPVYVPPILYYAPTCDECQRVIDFLERHHIQGVEMANIEEDDNAQEVIDASGQSSVPVFYFSGKFAIGADQCISMVSNLVMNGGKLD